LYDSQSPPFAGRRKGWGTLKYFSSSTFDGSEKQDEEMRGFKIGSVSTGEKVFGLNTKDNRPEVQGRETGKSARDCGVCQLSVLLVELEFDNTGCIAGNCL
jgi:hypothetical protein